MLSDVALAIHSKRHSCSRHHHGPRSPLTSVSSLEASANGSTEALSRGLPQAQQSGFGKIEKLKMLLCYFNR